MRSDRRLRARHTHPHARWSVSSPRRSSRITSLTRIFGGSPCLELPQHNQSGTGPPSSVRRLERRLEQPDYCVERMASAEDHQVEGFPRGPPNVRIPSLARDGCGARAKSRQQPTRPHLAARCAVRSRLEVTSVIAAPKPWSSDRQRMPGYVEAKQFTLVAQALRGRSRLGTASGRTGSNPAGASPGAPPKRLSCPISRSRWAEAPRSSAASRLPSRRPPDSRAESRMQPHFMKALDHPAVHAPPVDPPGEVEEACGSASLAALSGQMRRHEEGLNRTFRPRF